MNDIDSSINTFPHFVVRGVEAGHDSVEAWSVKRLPFEPKGYLLEMRSNLRTALQALKADPGQVLHATYLSNVAEPCDAENVLLYNVGTGRFAGSAHHGLRFERAFASPPLQSLSEPFSEPPQHYHQYRIADRSDGYQHWQRGKTMAQWNSIALSSDKVLGELASAWYAMKHGEIYNRQTVSSDVHFGLSVEICTPFRPALNLASLVKPLFDGIISAFGSHDGSNLDLVCSRLGNRLRREPSELANLLMADEHNVLGRRKLLWPYGEFVQWNPADDRCVVGEILVNYDASASGSSISGTLFTVAQSIS